jgi:hypothetical protein
MQWQKTVTGNNCQKTLPLVTAYVAIPHIKTDIFGLNDIVSLHNYVGELMLTCCTVNQNHDF